MKKILSFILNEKNELLLLKGSNNDPQFHESFWYTVTGAMESEDEDLYACVKREVKEETNLEVEDVLYLNWILKYKSLGKNCEEYVFMCKIKENDNIILNEENVGYKWCSLEEYTKQIKWYTDKNELKQILNFGVEFKTYFSSEKIQIIN